MRRGDHETSMALTVRLFLLRLAFAAFLISACAVVLRAGGPKCVAGPSYFDSTTSGQPLVWPQGLITYYTDQGDLSPILPNASANSFVTNAFSQWTSVSTAALSATSGGQLAEDVNGTNVIRKRQRNYLHAHRYPVDGNWNSDWHCLRCRRLGDGRIIRYGRRRFQPMLLQCRLWRQRQLRLARRLPARSHRDQWPVRATIFPTHRCQISSGARDR